MRITKLINNSQLFLKQMYAGQSGEFVCGSWDLKMFKSLKF